MGGAPRARARGERALPRRRGVVEGLVGVLASCPTARPAFRQAAGSFSTSRTAAAGPHARRSPAISRARPSASRHRPRVWIRLLTGEIEPGAALMGGGLKLTRGSFFSLLPHLKAAQALLECARLVPTHLPASDPLIRCASSRRPACAASTGDRCRSASSRRPSATASGTRADIDFAQDRADWAELASDERDLLLRLTSMFQAGEESVTLDLLPLIQVIAGRGPARGGDVPHLVPLGRGQARRSLPPLPRRSDRRSPRPRGLPFARATAPSSTRPCRKRWGGFATTTPRPPSPAPR